MKILKRGGDFQELSLDQILIRIRNTATDKNLGSLLNIDCDGLGMQVVQNLYDGISSTEIDEITARLAFNKYLTHPEYAELASRIVISNMHKNTPDSFSKAIIELTKNEDIDGKLSPILDDNFIKIVDNNKKRIDSEIDNDLDYTIEYFGYKTMEHGYLLNIYNSKTKTRKQVERPQYLFMRTAIGIHMNNLEKAFETYRCMAKKYFIHATPTLFNMGTKYQQAISCFLLGTEDSIEGIFKTFTDCGQISKWSGGIGVHISNIRATGSMIRSTNGTSLGIVPMLKVYNDISRYINQGGKRNGSFAIYLEVFHADIIDFLNMKRPHGEENQRGRDLFYAVWVSDYFMRCVRDDKDWYLMCPDQSPGLTDVYGEEYDKLYDKYISEKKYVRKIKAREIWDKIIESQIESGVPYISYKDSINKKNNQKNLGTIKSSNLCNEIVEYSDSKEYACCTIANVGLSAFVVNDGNSPVFFDYDKLHKIVKIIVENLNIVIDINFYPTPETKFSNKRHRPLGIGIQGLADVFSLLRIPFYSEEAAKVNRDIAETMYHAALEASVELAIRDGSYFSFIGSPASEGVLQFDMWGVDPGNSRYNWKSMKENIIERGLRNSLLISLMPTSSTASIFGNTECFECPTSNIYVRRVLSGEFIMVNKHLARDLVRLNLWNKEIVDKIVLYNGSVQNIEEIPKDIKNLYKTVWEISQKVIIDQAKGRAPFVCQTQSMNVWIENPDNPTLTSMHFYGWDSGLKTGSYYIRQRPTTQATKVTIDPNLESNLITNSKEEEYCTATEGCTSCSS